MARRGENIYKRKDGRYEGRYVIGRENGRTRFGYVFGRQYADVRARLLQKKAETLAHTHFGVQRDGRCVGDWMDEWMAFEIQNKVKMSTFMVYHNLVQRHIRPILGSIPLNRLSSADVQGMVQQLYARGLSESTVRGAYRLLAAGMRAAQEEGLIARSPCRRVRVPHGEPRGEQRVLTLDEQRRLERALDGEADLPALMALYTGMRLGEVCGLRWEDIDWQRGTVTVRRTVQRLRRMGGEGASRTWLMIGAPKTYRSHRVIPLTSFLLDKLCALARRSGEGYIFGRGGVRAADPRTAQRRLGRALAQAGIRGAHFHTLRHSFATRLLELGVDIKTISVLMGHSSPTVTLGCYAHSLTQQQWRAVARLEGIQT